MQAVIDVYGADVYPANVAQAGHDVQ